MGRKYIAPLSAVSVSVITDLWFFKLPATAVVALHEVVVTQDTSETSEQLPLQIFRTADDKSGVGTALTPAKTEVGDAAAGCTVRSNLSAGNLATVTTLMYRQSQNVLGGWHWLWTPETRPVFSPSSYFAIGMPVAPTAALPISGYVVFEEIGG